MRVCGPVVELRLWVQSEEGIFELRSPLEDFGKLLEKMTMKT
jgi:hypothetical protein